MAQNSPSGRFTPKGGINAAKAVAKNAAGKAADGAEKAGEKVPSYAATGRYTPPKSPSASGPGMELTKPWVPWLMGIFLILGLLVIVLNYIDQILPSAPSNWYLLGGLVSITLGFMTATQLK
jgi:Cell division protein CrgA